MTDEQKAKRDFASATKDDHVADLELRIAKLITFVCIEDRPCKACGTHIYFLPMAKSGKVNPFTIDGISHFANCPNAKDFRKTS